MNRLFSLTSLTVLIALGLASCGGNPPKDPASSGDANAKAAVPPAEAPAGVATAETPAAATTPEDAKTADAEKLPPSNAEATDCPRGGCRYTCAAGKTCDEKCKGGACDLKVEKDAKGTLDCSSGSCKINCLPGGTCNLKCAGGFCKSICAAGSTCNIDCEGKGGQCETECAKGATCDVKCPSNDCKPEPKKGAKK